MSSALVQSLEQLLPADLRPMASRPEVLLAVALVFATLLYVVLLRLLGGASAGGSRKAVVVGPSGAGKTCLFHQLTSSSPTEGTVASMQENEGTCEVLNDKGRAAAALRVVDVPGHERLRHKLDQQLRDARAVVFVLDAVEITPSRVGSSGVFCWAVIQPCWER